MGDGVPFIMKTTWGEVVPKMRVVTDEGCDPRRVQSVTESNAPGEVYVTFYGGGGHSYPRGEAVSFVFDTSDEVVQLVAATGYPREMQWSEVRGGMLVVTDEYASPRLVMHCDAKLSDHEVYVRYADDTRSRYLVNEPVTVLSDDPLVRFRKNAFLATRETLETLLALNTLMERPLVNVVPDEGVAFLHRNLAAEWDNLKQLMREAGF